MYIIYVRGIINMKISHIPEIENIFFSTSIQEDQAILAAVSARQITKNMVRVKSSNIWSYCMDIRHAKDKTGTLYIQFKGKKGGPDDVYCYYDIPVVVWHRFMGAPSKGHFFWKYIRNNFLYAKLTGDKKTRLKNGVNSR